jgi:hypothetical protein
MSEQAGALVIPVTGVASTAGGGIVAQVNTEGADLIITSVRFDRRTKSTGAASVDIGIAATVATNDTIMDGLDVGAAEGIADNITNKGSNGLPSILWPAGYYLTMTGTATTAGMKGNLYVRYYRRQASP